MLYGCIPEEAWEAAFQVAISALFETRLSGMALALGDLDREDCEQAIAWANGVLSKPIHLPVCVHAEALISRLRSTPEPTQVVDWFNKQFLGSKTDRWRAHVRLLADLSPTLEALATELGSYHGPLTLGAIVEVRAWLDATGDLKALAQAACKEERGPKRLMEAPESTWALVSPMDFDDLKRFEERGGIGALQGIFGSFYEEMNLNTGLRGFHCNVEEAVQALAPVLEMPEARLRKLLASTAAKTTASMVEKALAHWDQSYNVEQILEDPSWLLEET